MVKVEAAPVLTLFDYLQLYSTTLVAFIYFNFLLSVISFLQFYFENFPFESKVYQKQRTEGIRSVYTLPSTESTWDYSDICHCYL